jgi:hypothetical protein
LPVMGGTLPRLVTRSFGIQRQLVQVQAPGPAAQVPPAEPPRATANISSIRRIVAVVDLSAVICKSFRAQPTRVPGASVHDPCGTVEGLLLLARHCVDKRGFRQGFVLVLCTPKVSVFLVLISVLNTIQSRQGVVRRQRQYIQYLWPKYDLYWSKKAGA